MRKLTKYNKEEFQLVIDNSETIADVCRELYIGTKGNNYKTIMRYIDYFNIDISHFKTKSEQLKELHTSNKISLDEILVENSTYSNNFHLKKRLIKEGFKENVCEVCDLNGFWNGKELIMQLDHINGVNNDNRIENLRMICPNCHSQTETFCGKNKGTKAIRQKERELNGGRTNKEIESSISKRKVVRPTKEVLIQLIKDNGFSRTGKLYGIDGNSVKKWCISYGIPKYIKDYK